MKHSTKKTPLTYICIINWNDYANTSECLKSVQRIDYPNYRVVLLDNGSEDGSGQKLKKDFPWVVLLENKKNLGFSGGNNVGIRYAMLHDAEYVFLLNNDTVVDPQVLETLVDVAASDDGIGIVGPAIYSYSKRDVFWSAGMEKVVPNGKIFPHFVMRGCGEVDQGKYRCIEDVDMINACALLIKQSVMQEVGLLDEKFFVYNEDSDWNDRVASAGYRIIYVPEARIWHKGSVSLGGVNSPAGWFYTVRNQLFFFMKRTSWAGWPRLYFDFIRENYWLWKGFMTKGEDERAQGVLDGIWCGIMNKGGIRSAGAPGWFKRMITWKMYRDEKNRSIASEALNE